MMNHRHVDHLTIAYEQEWV